MKRFIDFIFVIGFTAVLSGFFLPWVQIEAKASIKAKFFKIKTEIIQEKITGFEIPKIANSKAASLVNTITEGFFAGVKNIKLKSYLVFLVPILAVICLWFFLLGMTTVKYNIISGIIGIVCFSGMYYKISLADLSKLAVKLNIDYGLWMAVIGFLFCGVSAFLKFALKP